MILAVDGDLYRDVVWLFSGTIPVTNDPTTTNLLLQQVKSRITIPYAVSREESRAWGFLDELGEQQLPCKSRGCV